MGKGRLTRRDLAMLGIAAALPGCGFRPVYAPAAGGGSPAQAELAAITVGPIPERVGQLLRLALQERFERGGTAIARRYDLNVSYTLASEAIGIQPDTSTTRVRMVGTANWTLTAQDPTRSTVTSGTARSVDGYNIFNQQMFAAQLESEQVSGRIAEALADQIFLQLGTFFNKRAKAG